MPTDASTRDDGVPADPADLLPATSVLDLDEYLAMQKAIGDRTRFTILYTLVHGGARSPTELEEELRVASNNLHYHLRKLVDVGLVERRTRTEADQRGLFTYYGATSLGEGILEHGVEELMRREWDFLEAYGGESPG